MGNIGYQTEWLLTFDTGSVFTFSGDENALDLVIASRFAGCKQLPVSIVYSNDRWEHNESFSPHIITWLSGKSVQSESRPITELTVGDK